MWRSRPLLGWWDTSARLFSYRPVLYAEGIPGCVGGPLQTRWVLTAAHRLDDFKSVLMTRHRTQELPHHLSLIHI